MVGGAGVKEGWSVGGWGRIGGGKGAEETVLMCMLLRVVRDSRDLGVTVVDGSCGNK